MRMIVLTAASLLAATVAQAAQPGEQARIRRENAAQAIAAARNIARGEPEGKAAACHVFLSLSISTHHSRAVGFSEAMMERERSRWYRDLVRRLGGWQVADQLIASSVNPLAPATPRARDGASRWCVQHAPGRVRARRG